MNKTKLLEGKSKFLDSKVKVLGKSPQLKMSKTKCLKLGKSKELASLKKLKTKY
jgi:hypothetical protein